MPDAGCPIGTTYNRDHSGNLNIDRDELRFVQVNADGSWTTGKAGGGYSTGADEGRGYKKARTKRAGASSRA